MLRVKLAGLIDNSRIFAFGHAAAIQPKHRDIAPKSPSDC
jgi:hypothetical protein